LFWKKYCKSQYFCRLRLFRDIKTRIFLSVFVFIVHCNDYFRLSANYKRQDYEDTCINSCLTDKQCLQWLQSYIFTPIIHRSDKVYRWISPTSKEIWHAIHCWWKKGEGPGNQNARHFGTGTNRHLCEKFRYQDKSSPQLDKSALVFFLK
jgi:hypothetical protein